METSIPQRQPISIYGIDHHGVLVVHAKLKKEDPRLFVFQVTGVAEDAMFILDRYKVLNQKSTNQ